MTQFVVEAQRAPGHRKLDLPAATEVVITTMHDDPTRVVLIGWDSGRQRLQFRQDFEPGDEPVVKITRLQDGE